MANQYFPYLCFALIFQWSFAFAQLSPGKLSEAHRELEGIGNCTQCHVLGKKVSSQKCLECHDEIKFRVDRNQGYHSSFEVVSKECIECHSDHHGRKFDMIRFDTEQFDHNLTGYALEGQHAVIDCRSCHISEYIADDVLSKRENTFLGLEKACLSCHADFHQGTLSEDCIACHSIDAFRPAVHFDHDDSKFRLKGKHIEVDCIECHQMTTHNGTEFQQFTELNFRDCNACHNDPHHGNFANKCVECHTETSFSTFIGSRSFNHNRTRFHLNGSHKNVDCFACHVQTSVPELVFQDRLGTETTQCVECHEDVHEGKFGSDCVKCHNEESFLLLNDMNSFDHALTDYALEGLHTQVDCKSCHAERYTDPIDFSECRNCHEDYHNGAFVRNTSSPDCVQCHTVFDPFDFTTYSLEQHQVSQFPLEGAHVATPCYACHVSEDRWTFRNIGMDCIDCHQDIHEGFISENYYPEKDCESCHNVNNWREVSFDHQRTGWVLAGKHAHTGCRNCHFYLSDESRIFEQRFLTASGKCIECHDNVHDDQFAINGETECGRCHDSKSWFPSLFDHDSTAFPLEGRHAEIACNACHEPYEDNGELFVQYKMTSFQCIDCHQ